MNTVENRVGTEGKGVGQNFTKYPGLYFTNNGVLSHSMRDGEDRFKFFHSE